jgi:hypothetical protein
VKADITGRVITIEGNVEGDLKAKEQIILRGSSTVHGDLKAPRVVLEDGASFRGLVDMGAREPDAPATQRPEKTASAPSAPAPAATGAPAAGARPPAPVGPKPDAAPGKTAGSQTRPIGKGNDASERASGT